MNFLASMHACFNVDEIVRLLACELVASRWKKSAVALACCCKNLEDPVLDVLWEAHDQLHPLLKSFPGNIWDDEGGTFVSVSTALRFYLTKLSDWVDFQENPDQSGMGSLPEVHSKDPDARSESFPSPHISRCSLGTATSHLQHDIASGFEDFQMRPSDHGLHSIHLFVSLPENHVYRRRSRQRPSGPPYIIDRFDDRHPLDNMSQPATDFPTQPTQRSGYRYCRLRNAPFLQSGYTQNLRRCFPVDGSNSESCLPTPTPIRAAVDS